MSALRPMPVPREVGVEEDGTIRVVWRDGHVSAWSPKPLRVKCPCAGCIDEWTGEVKVKPEMIPDDIRAQSVSRVGNYALTFTWSDGHSTGIYPYDRLRALCPCDACRQS